MQINQMTINYMTEPIGYNLDNPVLRYQVSTDTQVPTYHAFEISLDKDFTTSVTAKPKERIDSYCFYPTFILSPRQRYYWRVTVWDENDTCVQSTSWFETGKLAEPWYGQWITPIEKSSPAIDICHSFQLKQPVKTARLYIVGLGVYEAYINEHKIGDEYLTPGYNNYHEWIQYQSYDVTENVQQAQCHLRVMLGNGWYKGNFGFHGGTENIYGDQFLLKAELHVTYQDGETTIISSDDTWQAIPSTVKENSIYYGEDLDLAMCRDKAQAVCLHEGPKGQVTERMSVPVRVQSVESVKHFEQIDTEEWLLDFGQNMVGWVNVLNQLPKGHTLKLEFAETLVNGQFYRENLRAARAAFTFVSDGHAAWLRPHFTFFGFRYVRVTGWPEHLPFNPDSFVGQVVYSTLPVTGSFETSNPKVNRLFENIQWSQKGNFLDVPMDCPQRDERMGWTGDAQIFSQTALYNMAAYPFFRKYLHDMATEQPNVDGAPPMTVPNVPSDLSSSPAAVGVWGDAATIIPWNLYRYYGEKQILEEQYQSMKEWIAYINRKPHVRGLWDRQFQFGDWLALDGDDPDSPIGGTEAKYVANIFCWYSVTILQKTAQIIGRQEEAGIYEQQQRQLKKALKDEYFTPNGRLSIDTQTGYVLALYFELYEEGQSDILVEKLQERLAKDNYHLQTGFVGTPFLNLVLSKYGLSDIAYTLLLNEDYPSWLYAVNMGATTIWERWNSILPDGQMNPLGMNSLNHYAYGAIGQWFYEGVLGINQLSESSGFQKVIISPTIHWSLSSAKGGIETPLGLLKVSWRYIESDLVALTIDVPTLMEAKLVLPDVTWENQEGQTLSEQAITLVAGENKYYARLQKNKKPHVSDQMTLSEILSQPLLSVRAKQVFVGTRLFSSSNLRDHKKQPLSFFVEKNLISSEQVNQFLTQINAMMEESV